MNELVELAIAAHGGIDRWNEIAGLDVRVSLTGQLYGIKAQPQGMPNVLLRVNTQAPAMQVSPFGTPGHVGHFRPQQTWITDGAGKVMEVQEDPRDSFAGHTLTSIWNRLQLLYFNSYAMWNYLSTPFMFIRPGFGLAELAPHREAGEVWRRLQVKFPPDIPTHCDEQMFYFNESGVLQRIDYVTDVAGGVAAHYCYDHQRFGGILFPTLRRVVRRTAEGPQPALPTAILIQITDILVISK